MGLEASDINTNSLSSLAIRLVLTTEQDVQRCTSAHSCLFLTQIEMGSIFPWHRDALSPGLLSRCRLHRHNGQ